MDFKKVFEKADELFAAVSEVFEPRDRTEPEYAGSTLGANQANVVQPASPDQEAAWKAERAEQQADYRRSSALGFAVQSYGTPTPHYGQGQAPSLNSASLNSASTETIVERARTFERYLNGDK